MNLMVPGACTLPYNISYTCRQQQWKWIVPFETVFIAFRVQVPGTLLYFSVVADLDCRVL